MYDKYPSHAILKTARAAIVELERSETMVTDELEVLLQHDELATLEGIEAYFSEHVPLHENPIVDSRLPYICKDLATLGLSMCLRAIYERNRRGEYSDEGGQ